MAGRARLVGGVAGGRAWLVGGVAGGRARLVGGVDVGRRSGEVAFGCWGGRSVGVLLLSQSRGAEEGGDE